MEAEGYGLHRLWQKYLLDLCERANEATLNKYWHEYTAEVVSSAVTINPSNRAFRPQETYRSAYLDELAAAATFAEGPDRNRPFPKCLYEYRQKIFTDRSFYELFIPPRLFGTFDGFRSSGSITVTPHHQHRSNVERKREDNMIEYTQKDLRPLGPLEEQIRARPDIYWGGEQGYVSAFSRPVGI